MEKPGGKELGPGCEKSLNELLAEAQPGSNWEADPVLEDACEEVVMTACDPKDDNDAIMSCLMEQLSKEGGVMNQECRSVLMQLHYFLAREVVLDETLYKKCKADAERVCDAKTGWHRDDSRDPRTKLIFPCLVRNLYNDDEEDDNEIEG